MRFQHSGIDQEHERSLKGCIVMLAGKLKLPLGIIGMLKPIAYGEKDMQNVEV